ncbi:hypothetical protein QWY16_19255 [Planococcus shenhongbingii]|uniref:hypothetical protein n=1 Tax=Planococcus shenhongbingii TaxID=3058398 RepID=UPI00261329C3|nr:hypothetical protein [Planococcus sp. N016]WKA58601.1 hypothetical protein QWY16_19255 [Planococcus sp. N016]
MQLDKSKSGGARLALTSAGGLEGNGVLVRYRQLFSCVEASEAIQTQVRSVSRGWAPELDKSKSGNGRSGSTGVRRTSEAALFAAQPGWLTTREPGRCSWISLKAKRPFPFDRRKPV